VTCAAIDAIPAGVALNGTIVLVLCAAEIVSVSVVLAPRVTVDVAGTRETTLGAAGLTLIWLEAEEPFRLAVICAAPGETPLTGTSALTCPAGTLTAEATEAMFALLLASRTCVSADCAAEIVTVRLPVAPCVTVSDWGARFVTVGGTGVTFTVELACPPFADAVMTVLPTACAVTGIVTLVWPEAKLTLAGIVATAVFALDAFKVPVAVGVGESVAVRVPLAPTVTESGLGVSEVGLGKFGVANTVTVMTVLVLPAT
jgi:hypothetical protein